MPLYPAAAVNPLPGNSTWGHGGVETFTRLAGADNATGSGVLWLSYVDAPATVTISNLGFSTGATAATGLTLCRLSVFTCAADDSLTMTARTASNTGVGGSANSDYSLALATAGGFPSSYTLGAGQRYAFGILQVGSQAASLRSLDSGVNSASPPVISRRITAQADVATTYAVGALSTWFVAMYLFGTP